MPQHPKGSNLDENQEADRIRVLNQLKVWRERLIDLTRRNPLLGINRARTSKLEVTSPSAEILFDALVINAVKLRMPLVKKTSGEDQASSDEGDDPRSRWIIKEGDITLDGDAPEIFKRLRRIRDNARTSKEERGLTTLHLTLGTLNWNDPLLGESVAPIFLIPCEFESTGPEEPWVITATDEEPQINPALDLFLRIYHKKEIPALSEEPTSAEFQKLFAELKTFFSSEWAVKPDVWLSTFSYEALVMYKDLQANSPLENIAISNEITRALSNATLQDTKDFSDRLGDDLDAMDMPDVVPVPVLPADSSQLSALVHSHAERHVLVDGPPGTGKSQTIANIIADVLAGGKTVLFVSAKIAALEVVYDRLRKLGLGRFCLEAHSTKAGKARVMDELKRTLGAASSSRVGTSGSELPRYRSIRESLNEAVRELHKKREPLGYSIYQAFGLYSQLDSLPSLFGLPWRDVTTVTPVDLQELLDQLRVLQSHSSIFTVRKTHPWRTCRIAQWSHTEQERILEALKEVHRAAFLILSDSIPLEPLFGLHSEYTLKRIIEARDALQAIIDVVWLPADWANKTPQELSQTSSALEALAEKKAALDKLLEIFATKTNKADPIQVNNILTDVARFEKWFRRISRAYLAWRNQVKTFVHPVDKRYRTLVELAQLSGEIVGLLDWFKQNEAVTLLCAQPAAQGIPSVASLRNASQAYKHASVIRKAQERSQNPPTSSETKFVLDKVKDSARLVLNHLSALDKGSTNSLSVVQEAWPENFTDGVPMEDARLSSVLARCEESLKAPDRLSEWVEFQRCINECNKSGLHEYLAALDSHGCTNAVNLFLRRFWLIWADAWITRHPGLSQFSGSTREDMIHEFHKLDVALQQSAIDEAIKGASHGASLIVGSGYAAGDSQLGILRKQLQKKRTRPLRKLFADIPQVLQAIKPCMLMSPVSVSTYLDPAKITFDVVVFDEASQIPPQEAIPSILRARQVIVAGDDNQLPPTSFFMSSLFDEENDKEEENDAAPLESLLRQCTAIVPLFRRAPLRWHYRSRDERLITFSNHFFYEGSLVTWPSPGAPDDRGVQLRYVQNGVWDRGKSKTNRVEARAVAEEIVTQLDSHPERSIGVVALNISQMEAIEDALDEVLLLRGDLAERLYKDDPEPFFIKALEHVQGDERDTIIISIGFGPDHSGAVHKNFGPINSEGGWRRLNVLVTRAKYLTVLFTSMKSAQLADVSPSNRGATALKQFIEYAERGGRLPQENPSLTNAPTNDFEDAIASALRNRGLVIDEQVGVSQYRIDLAVRDPRDPTWYVLGIECDGATYHSLKTARDRDIIRAGTLRNLGWRLHRIWSIEWFRNPQKAIEATILAVEKAIAMGPPSSGIIAPSQKELTAQTTVSPPVANPSTQTQKTLKYSCGEPYQLTPRKLGNRNLLLDRDAVQSLTAEVIRIVEVEAPIHRELILERLKEIHEVSRAGSNIQANFKKALVQASKLGKIHRDTKGFYWSSPSHKLNTFRESNRQIRWVATEEIRLAILYVVESQFGLPKESVVREVARVLGFGRTSTDITTSITDAVDHLIDTGELRLSGFQVVIP